MQHQFIVQELIKKYTDLNLLEPIDSPFRAATVLVKKKSLAGSTDITDSYRLCTDYRALNKEISSSDWPAPSLAECLDAACDSEYFSSIDFNSGYHQISCTSLAKEALAFSPGYGFPQLTWTVMPPGVKNASSCFQRAMNKTFVGHEHRILPPYYDDVVIKGRNFADHLDNVKQVLNAVQSAGFTLNLLKCSFFQQEVSYLGHVIQAGSIRVDPNRVCTVTNFPRPTSVPELRRFIGIAQFCNRFIPYLNVTLSPLFRLLQKNAKYEWTSACNDSFNRVKEMLSSAPVLSSPTIFDKLILETDACDIGAGSCLKGVNEKGHEYIISYNSHKFNDTEQNWNIVEKEAFSVVHAIMHYRHYLIGTQFTIRVDSQIITYIQSKRQPKNRKLLNWALEVSEFDYQITHIPGKDNKISDCLSRMYSKNEQLAPLATISDMPIENGYPHRFQNSIVIIDTASIYSYHQMDF